MSNVSVRIVESGRVSAWLKKPGDTFARGETIAEIETDKVTVEMPALDAGRLTEILVPEGSEAAVGEPLGRYDAAGDAGAIPTPRDPPTAAPALRQEAPVPASPPGVAAPPRPWPRPSRSGAPGGQMLKAARDAIGRLAVKCAGPAQDVMQLSGGNQQKVAFGRWLVRMDREAASKPPLLLIDNPTEGVDVGSKAELYELIRGFAAEGAAVLIASAEFGELLKLCDRIHCIADDTLGTCLERRDFSEERLLLEVN